MKEMLRLKFLRSGIAVETKYYFNRLLLPYLKCSKVAKSCSHNCSILLGTAIGDFYEAIGFLGEKHIISLLLVAVN